MAADLKLDDLAELGQMDWAAVAEETKISPALSAQVAAAAGVTHPETPSGGTSSYPASPSLGGMKGPDHHKKVKKIRDSDVPKTGPFVAAIKNLSYTLPPDDCEWKHQ